MKTLLLSTSHGLALALGFALGIYSLPILTAPEAPTSAEVSAQVGKSIYRGEFRRELKDSDAFHWGEGVVSVSSSAVALAGELAPGPDYKLYLSPVFVETEADFLRLKSRMLRVGEVKTFKNFVLPLPGNADPARFNTVVIWCKAFGQFITAAQYREVPPARASNNVPR